MDCLSAECNFVVDVLYEIGVEVILVDEVLGEAVVIIVLV